MSTYRGHLATVVVAALVSGGFAALLLLSDGRAPFSGSGSYQVRAIVPDAKALGPGSEVRIAGLQVGTVASLERRGNSAVITLDIDESQRPLARDTELDIRLRSFVGENYVTLFPGRSQATLPDGGVLPTTSLRHEYVDVEQILDTLEGRSRDHVRQLLRRFGRGLEGRGKQLNATLRHFSGVIDEGAPILRLLRQDRRAVARLIDESGVVARAIGDRSAAIRLLARSGTRTFAAIADRDESLRALLDGLPSTFRQVRHTSAGIRTVTRDAAPVLSELGAAIDDVRPTLRALRPAARAGTSALDELRAAAPRLETTLTRVQALATPTASALPKVRRALCQANPLLGYLAPYADVLGSFVANITSGTNYYDATGHAARHVGMVGEQSFGLYGPEADEAVEQLLSVGALGKLRTHGYNPIPKRSDIQIGPPAYGKGLTGPSSFAKGPRAYPRVRAEC